MSNPTSEQETFGEVVSVIRIDTRDQYRDSLFVDRTNYSCFIFTVLASITIAACTTKPLPAPAQNDGNDADTSSVVSGEDITQPSDTERRTSDVITVDVSLPEDTLQPIEETSTPPQDTADVGSPMEDSITPEEDVEAPIDDTDLPEEDTAVVDTSVTYGCTNPQAVNHNSDATTDDGSCLYNVTFTVDMSQASDFSADTDFVYINGTFNGWCGACAPMALVPGTGSHYRITIPLAPGDHEYKFTTNGWDGLVEEAPPECDFLPDDEFKNRGLNVGDQAVDLPIVCFGECDACAGPNPQVSHLFTVDMNCAGIEFNTVYVTGPWAGWCGACFPLSDPDGDNIWEGDFDFQIEGLIEYKYTVDDWAHQEDLIDDMVGGAACAPVTNYFDHANRTATAGEPPPEPDSYGSCNVCTVTDPPGPVDPPGYTLFWADEFDGNALEHIGNHSSVMAPPTIFLDGAITNCSGIPPTKRRWRMAF